MKTQLRTFTFILLAIVAIVAVLTFRAFAAGTKPQFKPRKFTLKIGPGPTNYADVDINAFTKALKDAHFPDDAIDIDYLEAPGKPVKHYPPVPVTIKTDKVTTSEVAKSGSAGDSVANDPSVTHRLTSDNKTDIKNVLDTFQ